MPQAPTLTPGSVFARDFRVVSPLAEGGMGSVYVVEQLSTSERRALKTMSPRLLTDARSRQRFDQEARVASRVHSDHVVKVIAAGVDDASGTPWLCMELLRGEDLATVIERRGALPPAEVATLFEQACHALERAHAAGIVHRDLKPENLFVAESASPGLPFTLKILDFGIARLLEDARLASLKTQGVGTPMWMAPEQCETGAPVGPPTDVFALGLIAFMLLTGRSYWRSANVAEPTVASLLGELLYDDIVPASARAAEINVAHLLPPGFDAWFARCVVRDTAARFADAGQARDALLPLLRAAPAPAPSPWSPAPASGHAFALGATAYAPASTGAPGPWPTSPRAPTAATLDAPAVAAAVPAAPRSIPRWIPAAAFVAVAAIAGVAAAVALSSRGDDGPPAADRAGALPAPPTASAPSPVPPAPPAAGSAATCQGMGCVARGSCSLEYLPAGGGPPVDHGPAEYVFGNESGAVLTVTCTWPRSGTSVNVFWPRERPFGVGPADMREGSARVAVQSGHPSAPHMASSSMATSGTVSVTRSGAGLSGTFDASFPLAGGADPAGRFRGSFNAPVRSAP